MADKWGEFSESGDCYVTYRPDLPKPQYNYLHNAVLLSSVNQLLSGGMSVKDGAGVVHQLIANNDLYGRLFYLRDQDTGKFWSPTWWPVKNKLDSFELKQGIGETQLTSSVEGVETTISITPDPHGSFEVWRIALKNLDRSKKRLSLFTLGHIDIGAPEFVDSYSARNTVVMQSRESQLVTFMRMSEPPNETFLWKSDICLPYDSLEQPTAVKEGKTRKTAGSASEALPGFHKKIVLLPNQTQECVVFVGAVVDWAKPLVSSKDALIKEIDTLTAQKGVKSTASKEVQEKLRILDAYKALTPEKQFDRYYNYFLPYQMLLNANWPTLEGESLESICFSINSGVIHNSSCSKESLTRLFGYQAKDGHFTKVNSRHGEVHPDVTDTISALESGIVYVNESGDKDILQTTVAYYDGGSAKLLEHVVRATQHLLENLSVKHMLKDDDGESTALTARFICLTGQLRPILEAEGEHHLTKNFQEFVKNARETINKQLWQSPWYSRGLDNGKGISPSLSVHGWDLAVQVWPILAGIPDKKKGIGLVDRLAKLTAASGPINFSGPYPITQKEKHISYTKPGEGYNSAIDVATALYFAKAAATLGAGEVAWRIITQIAPNYLSANPERFQSEPFWLPVTIDGPASAAAGSGHSTLASPAALLHQVVSEDIFGLQPTLDGLVINPCIPKSWRQVELTRRFRGADYHIRIENPFRSGTGVDRLLVDGIRLTNNLVRPFNGGLHYIEVVLG